MTHTTTERITRISLWLLAIFGLLPAMLGCCLVLWVTFIGFIIDLGGFC